MIYLLENIFIVTTINLSIAVKFFLKYMFSSVLWLFSCFPLWYFPSLSAIAKDRPTFYGRILPVLLGLEPTRSVVNGICVTAVHHALRKAFLTCLKCTHPSAAPVFNLDQHVWISWLCDLIIYSSVLLTFCWVICHCL